MRATKGFTIIELLIVIAVIIVIAAISIPAMLRSRMSAEETSAIASMRMIGVAQAQVLAQSLFPDPSTKLPMYATLEQLEVLDPPVLDRLITTDPHIKSGFEFSVDLNIQTDTVPDYSAYGIAIREELDLRNFFIDPEGVLRYTTDGSIPNIESQPL